MKTKTDFFKDATNADSPIHYVKAETDETEDNSSKDVDEEDAECVEEE